MTAKKIYNKALRRSEVAKKAYELAQFATFRDYTKFVCEHERRENKDSVIYTMTRIARLIGLPVFIRHGVVYERNADGEQHPVYILDFLK